ERTRESVEERANEIAERLHGGAQFTEMAEVIGVTVQQVQGLTRGSTEEAFGEAATGRLFTTPEGEIAVAQAAQPLDRVVFRTTNVMVPANTETADGPFSAQIAASLADDLLNQYLIALQDRLEVEVNQQAIAQAFGEAGGQ